MMRAALKRYASFAVWQRPGTAQGRMEVKMNQDELSKIRKLVDVALGPSSCVLSLYEACQKMPALLAEIDRLKSEVSDLEHERKDNDALLWKVAEQQKEIERLRAALEEYANEDNWDEAPWYHVVWDGIDPWEPAQEALRGDK
jgi:uncharacterized small protein (DUF1192 family)